MYPQYDNSCAHASDVTVYVPSSFGYVYAFNPGGSLKWQSSYIGSIYSTPAIDDAGDIWVTTSYADLYRVDGATGTATLVNGTPTNGWKGSPTIGPDGTIYWGDGNGYLNAVNGDGTFKWRYYMGSYADYSTPAVRDMGGTTAVYVWNTGYDRLYRIDDGGQGSPIYRYYYYTGGSCYGSPICDSTDKIFLGNYSYGRIYAITDTGTGFSGTYYYISSFNYRPYYGSLAIRENGGKTDVYWAGYYYTNHVLYNHGSNSFSNYWAYYTGYSARYNTPCIDANGNCYVGSDYNYVYSISSTGLLNWQSPYFSDPKSVTMGDDGRLYFFDENRRLRCIGAP